MIQMVFQMLASSEGDLLTIRFVVSTETFKQSKTRMHLRVYSFSLYILLQVVQFPVSKFGITINLTSLAIAVMLEFVQVTLIQDNVLLQQDMRIIHMMFWMWMTFIQSGLKVDNLNLQLIRIL